MLHHSCLWRSDLKNLEERNGKKKKPKKIKNKNKKKLSINQKKAPCMCKKKTSLEALKQCRIKYWL